MNLSLTPPLSAKSCPLVPLRLTAIILSLTILVACGGGGSAATMTPTTTGNPNTPPTGGGGGGGVANPLADLANFMPTTSSSIQAVQNIADATDASIDISEIFEAGSLDKHDGTIGCSSRTGNCFLALPGADNTMTFKKDNLTDISLIGNTAFFSASSYGSEITNGIPIEGIEGITFARGKLTGTREVDSETLEFESFAGWLGGSIFGIIQIAIGETNTQHQFISYGAGIYDADTAINPTATGTETTSARWEGATVASIKASREFIFGDATVTVNFTDTNVDLEFGNRRNLDNQEISNMELITYEDAELGQGRFSLIKNNNTEAFGRFYGTGYTEVGGWFNTIEVTGAFGGTRQ